MDLALKSNLQKMGAIAYTANQPVLSNPFLKPEACPGATGESIPDWLEKVDAWESGWIIESAALTDDGSHLKMAELVEIQDLRGMFGEAKQTVSIEKMNAAIAAAGAKARS